MQRVCAARESAYLERHDKVVHGQNGGHRANDVVDLLLGTERAVGIDEVRAHALEGQTVDSRGERDCKTRRTSEYKSRQKERVSTTYGS